MRKIVIVVISCILIAAAAGVFAFRKLSDMLPQNLLAGSRASSIGTELDNGSENEADLKDIVETGSDISGQSVNNGPSDTAGALEADEGSSESEQGGMPEETRDIAPNATKSLAGEDRKKVVPDSQEEQTIKENSGTKESKKTEESMESPGTVGEEEPLQAGAYSQEQISSIQSKVTLADRVRALKLVLSKLSKDDIEMLKKMLDGGVSDEEKEEAKRMVYEKFSDEEVKIIKEIYSKYMKQK